MLLPRATSGFGLGADLAIAARPPAEWLQNLAHTRWLIRPNCISCNPALAGTEPDAIRTIDTPRFHHAYRQRRSRLAASGARAAARAHATHRGALESRR